MKETERERERKKEKVRDWRVGEYEWGGDGMGVGKLVPFVKRALQSK